MVKDTPILGLTGGIGCGKNTAAAMFADLGVHLIDADIIARQLVCPGTPALHKIVAHFGRHMLLTDGTLNRALMRQYIFADLKKKEWLEKLLHPLIEKKIVSELSTPHSPYTMLVSPLLLETNQRRLVNRIVVVDVPQSLQITRVKARDNNNHEQIQRIIDTQMPRTERLRYADDILDNRLDIAHLQRQVIALHRRVI